MTLAPATAILLLGPTGAGKTPLGEYLEAHGLCGRRCAHFDFGEQLRRTAVVNPRPPQLSDADTATIADKLKTGALLHDDEFPIAARVLEAFIHERGLTADDYLVLNGLPRHVGQAMAIEPYAHVIAVVHLQCTPQVVCERVRLDTGGDRAGRLDDNLALVARKLRIFEEQTLPVVEHYRARGAAVHVVPVGIRTTPGEVVARLASAVNAVP